MTPAGNTVEFEFIDIFRVADGMLIEHWTSMDLGALKSQRQASRSHEWKIAPDREHTGPSAIRTINTMMRAVGGYFRFAHIVGGAGAIIRARLHQFRHIREPSWTCWQLRPPWPPRGTVEPPRPAQNGGFARFHGTDGSRFADEGGCVRYAARGGMLAPVSTLTFVADPTPGYCDVILTLSGAPNTLYSGDAYTTPPGLAQRRRGSH